MDKNIDNQAFFNHLLREGRKPSTCYRHVNIVKILQKELKEWNAQELENLLVRYKVDGKRHSYLNHIIDCYNLYSRFKGIETAHVKRFNDQPFAKATMSDDEIEKFLSLPCKRPGGKEEANYKTWTLFFSIMAFTGMRPGEIAHLTVQTVDFGLNVFTLEDTKTVPRYVPIPPNIKNDLQEHVKHCDNFLFPSSRNGKAQNAGRDGSVFDSVDWHYRFHERLRRMEIKRLNLTPYSLRHSLICRLLNEDVDLFKVQKIVGHRRIETTAHYRHLTTKDVQLALQKDPMIRKSIDPRAVLLAILEWVGKLLEKDNRFEKEIHDKGDEIIIRIKVRK